MKSLQSLSRAGVRLAALLFVCCLFVPGEAKAQFFCSAPNLVDVSFAAGTRWRFCWEIRQREGLVINRAFFTARGDVEREVLFRASVAQVHVPYFPGSPRFRDITVSTSGLGAGMLNLTDTDCAPINRLDPKICREIEDRGLAWKFSFGSQRGQQVTVWSSSQLGQYNYITMWTFKDDGTIEPKLGFTGRLQIVLTGAQFEPFGTPVDEPGLNRFAINHVHALYYRFDFDIDGSANNAVESRIYSTYTDPNPLFQSCSNFPGLCGTNNASQYLTETSDVLGSGTPFVTWRVFNKAVTNLNGRTIGYEIEPVNALPWYGEPTSEPWAQADVFVTRFDFCYQLATDNFPPFIDASCVGAPPDVAAMVALGNDVDGQDIMVWVRTTFQHLTREEDRTNMPIEFQGVSIQPRSWRHHSTLE